MSWANEILDVFENKNTDMKITFAVVSSILPVLSLDIGGKCLSKYVFLCSGVLSDKPIGHILGKGDLVIVARDMDKFYVLGKVMK